MSKSLPLGLPPGALLTVAEVSPLLRTGAAAIAATGVADGAFIHVDQCAPEVVEPQDPKVGSALYVCGGGHSYTVREVKA